MCSTEEYHNNNIHQIGSHDLMMKFLRKKANHNFLVGEKTTTQLWNWREIWVNLRSWMHRLLELSA